MHTRPVCHLPFVLIAALVVCHPWHAAPNGCLALAGEPRRRARAVASFDCSQVNYMPALECQALVALYEDTDGPGWTNNGGWFSNNTIWSGAAHVNGHVFLLELASNQLSGTIPSQLANLSDLTEVHLDSNQLSGAVPR